MATIGLAMIGLGGLQAFAVSLRQREIGVRQALGATPRHVLGMLMKDGMKPVIEGLAIGLGVLGLSHLLLRPFFSAFIPKAELWALVLVPLVTLGCAACAAYLPARATVRANPSDRLRQP